MDQQTVNVLIGVFGGLISIIGFCVAWWVNNIWIMVRSQQQQISALNIELAKNYAPRQELQGIFDRIFSVLDEIRRDQKAGHQ